MKHDNIIKKGLFIMVIVSSIIGVLSTTGIMTILQNVAFSIIAAYIFYFITVYVPNKTNAKKARIILKVPLSNIQQSMFRLLAILNGVISINENGRICFISGVQSMQEKVYFKIDGVLFAEKLSSFLLHERNAIKNSINKMISNPIYKYLDEKTFALISELQTLAPLNMGLDFVAKYEVSTIPQSFDEFAEHLHKMLSILMELSGDKRKPTSELQDPVERKQYDQARKEVDSAASYTPVLNERCKAFYKTKDSPQICVLIDNKSS